MDNTIISNYHAVVKPEDTFYFLGDFSWNSQKAKGIWDSLPGQKYFIRGNHDSKINVPMKDIMEIYYEKLPITLCHYPMISWNKSHYNGLMLHGHHHHNLTLQQKFPGKRIDVGVDAWNFRPVPIDSLLRVMNILPDNWDYIKK